MSTIERNHTTKEDRDSRTDATSAPTRDAWWLRLLQEPLFHFLLLGGALFALHGYLGRNEAASSSDQQIVVSAGKIEHLAALFTRTWQRPPSREELDGLINDYIREEAAYREGTAIGLDQNDTIIRRRIRQKLDFVAEDLASQTQPTEEQLKEYLRNHPDDFRIHSRLTFRQVFFDPARHGEDLETIVNESVAQLRSDSSIDAGQQGDRTLLEFRFENVSQREVANQFGDPFAAALFQSDQGIWQGPIPSAYGVHLVIIDAYQPGRLPDLNDVRDAVAREWEHTRRQQLTEQYYEGLLEKYDVVIQWPTHQEESE